MPHRRVALALACAFAVAGLAAVIAQSPQLVPIGQAPAGDGANVGAVDETPALWFVELSSRPAVEGTSRSTLDAEKTAFRRNAAKAGLKYQERYAFSTLFNGFSVRISPSQVSALARVEGVVAIYPVGTTEAPPKPILGAGALPDLYYSLSMIGADIAQSELGFTGKGVKVAVMDTGIDYDHPDLGGDGVARSNSDHFPTTRVITGWDFVGDAYNADSTSPSYNPVPSPDPYPDDCYGHGTHVAGIIGANGKVKGVAPEVSFGAYRVFGCEGSTTDDVMIAAMERALADDMQVLNMSIGSSYQWPEYPSAMAATRLVNKGMVVVASIGNSGASGLYSAGAPGVGQKVIGVASVDNIFVTLPAFSVSPDNALFGYSAATGAPPPPKSGSFPMAKTGTTSTENDACSALPAGSLAGKVALIRRGTCSFYIKATNAQTAGAAGVVLYNNAAGFLNPTVAGAPPVTIPVVAVTAAQGAALDARIAAGPTTLTWTDQLTGVSNPTGGLISSFSSYGLSPDLAVKPDISAPGGNIYSTYPLELGGYTSMSGTSMASPHVAGTAALYLQAHPRTPSQVMNTVLQNTSVPKPWWGNPGLGFLDNVSRQGAGLVQIDAAILAGVRVEPGKLSLGESQAGPVTRTLNVENDGPGAVTFDLSFENALSVAKTFAPAFYLSDASVAFSVPSITVPRGGAATVDVTITPATGPDKAQYGGYIRLTPRGGGQDYVVPFAGFVGDYQSIQVLVPTANGFPWLAYLSGSSYYQVTDSHTYTMAGSDIPFFLVHLDHQSALMRMEVFDAFSGRAWHRAYQERYLPRNSTANGFFAFTWDGVTAAGNKLYTVPNGTYVVKISILKALGDSANPADWETWTSPQIVINR
jgi:subtilisin family serine protease